jgi:hypothetical protein
MYFQLTAIRFRAIMLFMAILFSQDQVAEIVGIRPGLLLFWLQTKQFHTDRWSFNKATEIKSFYFGEDDIAKLAEFVSKQKQPVAPDPTARFIDDGNQETFTVAEVASMWNLSDDTIRRLVTDEPGVVALGNDHPRGKRPRVTLRIPRQVMERVKRKRSRK